jgi:hypothetical protein
MAHTSQMAALCAIHGFTPLYAPPRMKSSKLLAVTIRVPCHDAGKCLRLPVTSPRHVAPAPTVPPLRSLERGSAEAGAFAFLCGLYPRPIMGPCRGSGAW